MTASAEVSADPVESRGGNRPGGVATLVLVLVMVLTSVPVIRLALVGLVPAQALVEGVRLPTGPPRLGLPFGEHPALGYWLAETLAAITLLTTFWARCRASSRRGDRGRFRVFAQVWADTLLATVVGCLVHAVAISLLNGDRPLSYLLMVGGTIAFAVPVGFVVGLLTGAVAALVQARRSVGSAPGAA